MRLFEANPPPESPCQEWDEAARSGLDPDTSKKMSDPRAGSVPLPGRFLRAASSGLPPPLPRCHTQLSSVFQPGTVPGGRSIAQPLLALKGHHAGEAARKLGWRNLQGLLARYTEFPQQVLPPEMDGVQGPPVPPPAIPLRILYPLWPQGSAKRAH